MLFVAAAAVKKNSKRRKYQDRGVVIAPPGVQTVRRIWYPVESVPMTSVHLVLKTDHHSDVTDTFAELVFIIICNVLDKLWKPGHDHYFKDLKENLQKILDILGQGHWMALTFEIQRGSCTHLIKCFYQLSYHRLQEFQKNVAFYLFPFKSLKDQIWPCHRMVLGQPRVILWEISVVLKYPMIHKLQGYHPTGSGKENFLIFFNTWYGGQIGDMTYTILLKLYCPILCKLNMKYDFN